MQRTLSKRDRKPKAGSHPIKGCFPQLSMFQQPMWIHYPCFRDHVSLEQRSHKFQNKFIQMLRTVSQWSIWTREWIGFYFYYSISIKKKILTASALKYLSRESYPFQKKCSPALEINLACLCITKQHVNWLPTRYNSSDWEWPLCSAYNCLCAHLISPTRGDILSVSPWMPWSWTQVHAPQVCRT